MVKKSLALLMGIVASMATVSGASAETNLITNPSFEQGAVGQAPPGWDLSGNGTGVTKLVTAAGGHSGKQEAQFSAEAPIKWVYIEQYVNTPAVDGEVYRYSGWVKASADTDVFVDLDAGTADGQRSVDSYKAISVGQDWTKFEVFLAVKNGPFPRLRVLAKVEKPGITVSIDDVELVKTPLTINAGPTVSRQRDLQRLQEPTDEIVSPHILWAKPSADKSLRVLFLTHTDGLREIVELRERFDLQSETFATEDQVTFSVPEEFMRKYGYQVSTDDVIAEFVPQKQEARLREKLGHPHDLIVIGNIKWECLPAWARSTILDQVRGGTGLVGYMLGGDEDSLRAALDKKIEVDPRTVLSAFPYAGLPAFRIFSEFGMFLNSTVRFAQYGKGRIAILLRRPPEGSAGPLWETLGSMDGIRVPPKQMLTPEVVDPFPGLHMVHYEYYLALVDHLMNWAAGRTPSVRVIEPPMPVQRIQREEPTPLRVELESDADRTVTIQWAVRGSDSGQVWKQDSKSQTLHQGRNEIDLPVADVPAGTYFVDVWVKDNNKTIDFGSVLAEIQSRSAIESLALAGNAFNKTEPIRGTVALDGAKAGQALQIAQWDNYGRQIASQTIPIQAGTSRYPFALEAGKYLSVIQTIEARLMDGATVLDVKREPFTIRDLYPDDDLRTLVVQAGTEGDTYLDVTLADSLHKMGFDFWFTGLGRNIKSYEELQDTPYYRFVRPPIEVDAKRVQIGACLLGNLYTMAGVYDSVDGSYDWYVYPAGDAAPSAHGYIRKPCLSNPSYRRRAADFYTHIAQDLSRFAVPVYDLCDEGRFADWEGRDLCFSDYSNLEFQDFVRDEYKTIERLNQEYGTSYKNWDEVIPGPYDEAKKEGKIPMWIDHRRHMETVWAGYFTRAKEAITQAAPGVKVGYHSTDDPGHTHCPIIGGAENYYLLAKAMTSNAPYYFPMQVDCVRDFSAPGTMIGNGAFGGTSVKFRCGRDSTSQRWWLWNALLRGANSIWIWHGCQTMTYEGYFNTVPSDFAPFEYVRSTFEEMRLAKHGIGKLLMSSQRPDDDIAVLYSPSSMLLTAFDTDMPARWDSPAAVPFVLTEAGFQYRMIAPLQLEDGILRKDKFRVLYLPYCQALSPKEIEEILAFAKAGGTVLADLRPGVADAHGKPYAQGGLDELFGVKQDTSKAQPVKANIVLSEKIGDLSGKLPAARSDSSLRVAGGKALGKIGETPAIVVNSYGQGRGVLFNLAFSDYMVGDLTYGPEFEDEEKATDVRALIRGVLEPGGIRPAINIDPYVPGMHVFRFSFGESQTLGLVWDAAPYLPGITYTEDTKQAILAAQSRTVTLRLASPAHIYDMRTGAYLGLQQAVQRTLSPGTVDLLATLPYKVEGLNLKLASLAVKQGEILAYTLSINVPKPSLHVFRVEFSDPDGKVAEHYSVNAKAPDGRYSGTLTTSLNEKIGEWKVMVKDVASGVTASTTFMVKR